MDFIIREALPEEAWEYAACQISSWRSAYQGIVPKDYLDNLSLEQQAVKIKNAMLTRKEYSYYCVTKEDQLIGLFILGKDPELEHTGELCAIYLLKQYWDKGIGGSMMDYAIQAFKEVGCTTVILWVLEENQRARKFYEKHQFVFDGTKKEIEIGKPLTELRYRLSL